MSCTFFKAQHNTLQKNINYYVIIDLVITLKFIFPYVDNIIFLNFLV